MKIYIFFLSLFFCSCIQQKDIVLLTGEITTSNANLTANFEPTFEINDIIEISLISENKEAALLFDTKFDEGKSIVTYNSGVAARGGFLIKRDGKITLPYIGEIHAEGKSRTELVQDITSKLSEYIKNPVVQINLLNFKITVLGEVKQAGTFNVPNEKINLIQAIATAGDFTNYGNKKEIRILREIKGQRKEFIVNLNDKSIFSSEAFFLKQNDIVYIPPLKSKVFAANNQLALPIVSFASLVLSALNLILK
jgi:polysaccharide export outer membrane protein